LFVGSSTSLPGNRILAVKGALQEVPPELIPEVPYKGRLQGGATQKLRFHIQRGQYFAIDITEPTAGLVIVLSNANGRVVRTTGCSYREPAPIAEANLSPGGYTLELSRCGNALPETPYELKLSRPRPTTPRDVIVASAGHVEGEADSLVRDYRSDSKRAALRKYDEALAALQKANDPAGETRILLKLSDLTRDFAQIDKATLYAKQALKLSQSAKNFQGEAESLLILATIFLRDGNAKSAKEYNDRVLEIIAGTPNPWVETKAYCVLGDIHYDLADMSNAAVAYSQASLISKKVDYAFGQAMSLVGLSNVWSNRSQLEPAKQSAEEALSIYKALGDKQGQAKTATFLGNIHTRLGLKQDALSFYEQARPLLTDSGDSLAEAFLFASIARTRSDLGDDSTALEYAKLAHERYKALNHRIGQASTLRALGGYYFRVGDTRKAEIHLHDAINAARDLKNKRLEIVSLIDIGRVSESVGEYATAIDYFNQALAVNRLDPDGRLESATLVRLAHVHENIGEFGEALEQYNQALTLSQKNLDDFGELLALYGVASSQRKLGRLNEALEESEKAIERIETLRSSVTATALRTSYFASVKQYYELHIDLLMKLGAQGNVQSENSRAFEASEGSHARSLLETIIETRSYISAGIDPVLLGREVSLRTGLDAKTEQYSQLLRVNSKDAPTLADEINRLGADYDQLLGQIRSQSPRYINLVRPQPLRLAEIQRELLDDDSLLLEYALGEDNSYLWAVTREGFSSYTLPQRSEIEAKVQRVRELMTANSPRSGEKPADAVARIKREEAQYDQAAAELSQMLLGPVADQLEGRHLVIVGEGVLQYLPFGALPSPKSIRDSSPEPLVKDHEIVNLPSASTLGVIRKEAALRGKPDRMLAIFADPVFQATDKRVTPKPATPAVRPKSAPSTPRTTTSSFSPAIRSDGPGNVLPRLLASEQEANAIAAMVPEASRFVALGFAANKAAATSSDLGRYKIVHFATHTVLNENHPDLSSLVMSLVDQSGKAQNGHLRLRDIYNLRLSAELVVLSACETALGKDVKGEGLMSLVRGFMYSGTPRVLASLWKVDDEATAELMTEFYKELLQKNRTPAAALRQAQITQMGKKSRRSPYYWAGFQLQGEWR
jgi:CHAT domain-containing protein/Tfp pilus assembly protein PilF